MRHFIALIALMLGTHGSAIAQVAPSDSRAPAIAPSETPSPTITIPAGTTIVLELAELLSSNGNHAGDTFALRLAEPIIVNGQIAVAAGAPGRGEVVDAGRAFRSHGIPGKLAIAARWLSVNGQQIPVRGMGIVVGSADATLAAHRYETRVPGTLFGTAPPPGPDRSSDIELHEGTRGYAKFVNDFSVPGPFAAAASIQGSPENPVAQCATGAGVPSLPTPPSDKAQIVFLRPLVSTAGAWTYHAVEVGSDDQGTREAQRVADLRNGSYEIYNAEPGLHIFKLTGPLHQNPPDSLRMEVDAGQRYMVELNIVTLLLFPYDCSQFASHFSPP